MAHVEFIGKGKVDGREYDRGNTLDVDEATKSRLLKEGCIEGNGDCSALQDENETLKGQLQACKNEAQAEIERLEKEFGTAKDGGDNTEIFNDINNMTLKDLRAKYQPPVESFEPLEKEEGQVQDG